MNPQDLVGKDVRGLSSLQVSGFSRLDGGLSTESPATLDGTPINGVLLPAAEGYGVAVPDLTLALPRFGRSLLIEIEGRSDQAATQVLAMQLNGDVGNNYDYHGIQDLNVTLVAFAPQVAVASGRIGILVPTGAAAGAEATSSVRIKNADSAGQRKMWTYDSQGWASDAAAGAYYEAGQGQWRNITDPIRTIKLISGAGAFAYIRARVYILA